MSCTLDASAKIYSYRVDKVYTDMLKILSNKDSKPSKVDKDSDDEEGIDQNEGGNLKSDGAAEESILLQNLRVNNDCSQDELSNDELEDYSGKVKL